MVPPAKSKEEAKNVRKTSRILSEESDHGETKDAVVMKPEILAMLEAPDDEEPEENEQGPAEHAVPVQHATGCRAALAKPWQLRTEADVDEIFLAVKMIQDPFFTRLEESVKRAVCHRLNLEEFTAGQMIFDYGEIGDRLYLIWSGRVQIEVPRQGTSEFEELKLVKLACLDPGKAFGELALMSADNRRKARCSAMKATELLTLTASDYKWCVGVSQEKFVQDRVNFLRSAEHNLLDGILEADLQAMAGCLNEEHYIGGHHILEQGMEVEKVIFVKSGFCEVVRQIHPRFRPDFHLYADPNPPMPNPFASTSEGLPVGSKDLMVDYKRSPRRPEKPLKADPGLTPAKMAAELGLGSHAALRRLIRQHDEREIVPPATPSSVGPLTLAVRSRQTSSLRNPQELSKTSSPGSTTEKMVKFPKVGSSDDSQPELVVVEILQEGRAFGIMELLEGLTYQCSVIPAPWTEIYSISKFDFIRNVSKPILHRFFCDYTAQLTDARLMQRLKQKNRWNGYKRELLHKIMTVNTSMSQGIIDRNDPNPQNFGCSELSDEVFERIGNGEQLWNTRAETPPKQNVSKKAVTDIFTVDYKKLEGKYHVTIAREQRDASMDALEEKLLVTVATARIRDKLRRKQRSQEEDDEGESVEVDDISSSRLPASKSGNSSNLVLQIQELEEQAKNAAKEHLSSTANRIEAIRKTAQKKASSCNLQVPNEVQGGRRASVVNPDKTIDGFAGNRRMSTMAQRRISSAPRMVDKHPVGNKSSLINSARAAMKTPQATAGKTEGSSAVEAITTARRRSSVAAAGVAPAHMQRSVALALRGIRRNSMVNAQQMLPPQRFMETPPNVGI